jgi:diguanylate cyclase (GGDEF)-like protein
MYQKLAFIDILTGSKNRLAYEKDMESLYNSKDRNRLLLIYFDFDDLKYINDKYGHLEGDKIIIEGYKVLSTYFMPYGHIYRVGGDEFVFLGFISQTDIEDRLDGFLSFLEKKNETLQYPISISYGHAYYDEVTMSKPKDLMKKADYQMYDLKKTKKANR